MHYVGTYGVFYFLSHARLLNVPLESPRLYYGLDI
jgi:hypothetical protein